MMEVVWMWVDSILIGGHVELKLRVCVVVCAGSYDDGALLDDGEHRRVLRE